MNKELKKMIQDAMEAPVPERKQEFLHEIEKRKTSLWISYGRFVAEQIFYVGKWGWCGSLGILLMALFICNYTDEDILWVLSAMIPFLAVSFMSESLRSEACGMAELEMATRFSLKCLILARMTIMGVGHLLLLGLNAFIGYRQGGVSLLHAGVYLLVPYLLTNAAGLYLARRIRGRECIYGILAVAAAVAVLPFAARLLYREELFIWWLAALVVFGALTVKEWKRNMEKWEEYAWNLL